MTIRKALFPVAGLGTRFLPATKANPKETLPVVDKPLIQYAVEEAVAAGVTEMIFVTGRNKRSIPDHFDKAFELEVELERKGKDRMLDLVRNIIPPHVSCIYIRQPEALGLGHAVLCAAPAVGNEPFAVLLADDLMVPAGPGLGAAQSLRQMADCYEREGGSVIGVETITPELAPRYGVIKPGERRGDLYRVAGIVEKPQPQDAPSNLGVVGRYVLSEAVFDLIRSTPTGAGGEIQLTDALAVLGQRESLFALALEERRYDCGSKLGYLEATVELGLRHPELGDDFRAFLERREG